MHERIVGLYEENAAAWDSLRGPDASLERPWLERFAARLPTGAGVLDIGCGSGQPVARWLIDRGFKVTGVDSSPSLVALCRARFPDSEWRVADMRELSLGERFDGLIARHSLFHLAPDDQRLVFPRFAAHVRPGAILMFTSGWAEGVRVGRVAGGAALSCQPRPGRISPAACRERLRAAGPQAARSGLRRGDRMDGAPSSTRQGTGLLSGGRAPPRRWRMTRR